MNDPKPSAPESVAAVLDWLRTARGRRLLRWLVVLAIVAGVLGFLAVGADGPADPVVRSQGLDAFGRARLTVARGDAAESWCALLADTEAQRTQGLRGRSDLGGYDAMVFRFPADTTAGFVMGSVPVDLDIAWFDSAGRFVSAATMAACPDGDDASCGVTTSAGPYRYAVETLRGGNERLRLGGGADPAVIRLGAPCAR